MSPVDALPPDQRAVLSLVLERGQGYEDISDMLAISPDAVRDRAHAALETLAPDAGRRLPPDRRAEIADYLLGQQSVSEREATRSYLAGSASGRSWARVVAGELEPLAVDGLPEIPDERAAEPELEPDLEPEPRASRPRREGSTVRERDPTSRTGGALLLIGLAAVVAVVVILLAGGGDEDKKAAKAPPTQATQTTQPTPVAQINLRAEERGSQAVGVAQVLVQNGQPALAIVGQNLEPSNRQSAYAVWLYNSDRDARALGFVDPPVGRNGRFSNFQRLPDNASKFKELIVTRETRESRTPGKIVLRGPLELRGNP